MTAIDAARMDIIKMVMGTNDVEKLLEIRQRIANAVSDESSVVIESTKNRVLQPTKSKKRKPIALKDAVTKVRPAPTLEEIKKAQNYKRITYAEWRALADKIEWNETLEELLAALTK